MQHATRSGGRYAAWVSELAGGRSVPSPAMLAPELDIISFGGGQPATELYPLDALQRAFSRALLEDGAAILPYGPIEGLPELRRIVIERLARRGIQADADQVVITTGSMQGLHLVGRIMLDHHDAIVTEAPTFQGALGTWEHQQPRYLTIGIDEHGMRVDDLARALRSAEPLPKFVYLLPTFQNPSGVTLSLERRQHLLEVASDYDLLLIEDDPYGEFWFDAGSPPVPPLRSLPGAEERVVYLGTFSKILAPGLRLAYAVASPGLRNLLVRAKRGLDYQTDAVVQQAVVRLLRDGDFDLEDHIARCRAVYKARRDAMLDALEASFGSDATWTTPEGGYFLWVEFGRDLSGDAVAAAGLSQGVSVWPGSIFFPNGDGGQHGIRLSYADTAPERIAAGLERLRRAVDSVKRSIDGVNSIS